MAAALASTSAAAGAVVVGPSAGPGSGSAATAEPAQKSAYVSRFPGLQASRFGIAAATSSALPAGSGAVAGSANEGDKNATASGAGDDDEEESEISGDVAEQAELHEARKRVSLLAAETAGAQAELKALKAEHECRPGAYDKNDRNRKCLADQTLRANCSGLLISEVVVETRPSDAQLNQQALQHVHAHASTAPALSGRPGGGRSAATAEHNARQAPAPPPPPPPDDFAPQLNADDDVLSEDEEPDTEDDGQTEPFHRVRVPAAQTAFYNSVAPRSKRQIADYKRMPIVDCYPPATALQTEFDPDGYNSGGFSRIYDPERRHDMLMPCAKCGWLAVETNTVRRKGLKRAVRPIVGYLGLRPGFLGGNLYECTSCCDDKRKLQTIFKRSGKSEDGKKAAACKYHFMLYDPRITQDHCRAGLSGLQSWVRLVQCLRQIFTGCRVPRHEPDIASWHRV